MCVLLYWCVFVFVAVYVHVFIGVCVCCVFFVEDRFCRIKVFGRIYKIFFFIINLVVTFSVETTN